MAADARDRRGQVTGPRSFASFAVFDWSGSRIEHPPGIALAVADGRGAAQVIAPRGHRRWSRAAALEWLRREAATGADRLIGIDISAGLPFFDRGAYFPGWNASPPDAPSLWAMVERLSAADPHLAATTFARHPDAARYFRHPGVLGDRYGPPAGRLRVVEVQSRSQGLARPYSSLNLVGAAQVGLASLSAMRLLHALRGILPVWPFDPVPAKGPLLVEIYAAIAVRAALGGKAGSKLRSAEAIAAALGALGFHSAASAAAPDEHEADALVTAAWLARNARQPALWAPRDMTPAIAATEGWTFGVL